MVCTIHIETLYINSCTINVWDEIMWGLCWQIWYNIMWSSSFLKLLSRSLMPLFWFRKVDNKNNVDDHFVQNQFFLLTSCWFWNIPIFLTSGFSFLSKQNHVWREVRSNYIRHILWDVITCPVPWYLLLAHNLIPVALSLVVQVTRLCLHKPVFW